MARDPLLALGLVLSTLGLLMAGCGPPGNRQGGRAQSLDLADPLSQEQQVWYTDMIEAYAAKRHDLARQLAGGYLEMDLHTLRMALNRRQWEGSLARLIVIQSEILSEENQLPVAQRLGGPSEFMELFSHALGETKDAFQAQEFVLPEMAQARGYYEHKLGMVARGWLVAQSGHVSSAQLLESFLEVEEALRVVGISDLEAALEPLPLAELPARSPGSSVD